MTILRPSICGKEKKSVSLIVHTYMENSIKEESLKTLFWCLFFFLNQCSILLKEGKEKKKINLPGS